MAISPAVTPAVVETGINIERARARRLRRLRRPFRSLPLSHPRRRDMKLSVLSRTRSLARSRRLSRLVRMRRSEVCELGKLILSDMKSRLRGAIFFRGAWRLATLRSKRKRTDIILRGGAYRRVRRDALFMRPRAARLKCNKSISVGFIFFPRFNLLPFYLLFWNTVETRKRVTAPGARRTSLESGPRSALDTVKYKMW